MPASDAGLEVVDDPAELRHELRRGDDVLGLIRYATESVVVVLIHTEVSEAVEGQGLGSVLVRGALDDVRAHGRSVVPCARSSTRTSGATPEYADIVEGRPPRWE